MDEPRLERLEERVAWLERHVGEQDKAMLELAEQLQRLSRELAVWRERLATREGGDSLGQAPADERPPHY